MHYILFITFHLNIDLEKGHWRMEKAAGQMPTTSGDLNHQQIGRSKAEEGSVCECLHDCVMKGRARDCKEPTVSGSRVRKLVHVLLLSILQ